MDTKAENKYTALIIEPRKHRALEFVLRNVLDNLESTWSIQVFHGTENEVWVKSLIDAKFQADLPRITLKNLGLPNLETHQKYSDILTSRSFIENIPTETFIMFQTDSMINPANRDMLAQFMQYDYVGAPWPWDWLHVGNGGFSLRKRSVMLKIIDRLGQSPIEYEDQYFSMGCGIIKANVPTRDIATGFSIEQIYTPKSFAIHKAWLHIPHKLKELCEDCEGLETLISLQSVYN